MTRLRRRLSKERYRMCEVLLPCGYSGCELYVIDDSTTGACVFPSPVRSPQKESYTETRLVHVPPVLGFWVLGVTLCSTTAHHLPSPAWSLLLVSIPASIGAMSRPGCSDRPGYSDRKMYDAKPLQHSLSLFSKMQRVYCLPRTSPPLFTIFCNSQLTSNPETGSVCSFRSACSDMPCWCCHARRFHVPSVVALTGATFPAELDGVAVECWKSFVVAAGQTLTIGAVQNNVGVSGDCKCGLPVCRNHVQERWVNIESKHASPDQAVKAQVVLVHAASG